MSKKIMILNGSPRKNGNTSALVNEFTKGAEEVGHTVTEFFLDKMNINGCKGCFGGGKNFNSPCVQKDDMIKIYQPYRDADVVVLATPIYYWTVSGQLKTAFDYIVFGNSDVMYYRNPIKKSVLLMAAEGNEFEEAVSWYEHVVCGYLGWKNRGEVLCGSVLKIGDISGHDELKAAYELGKKI